MDDNDTAAVNPSPGAGIGAAPRYRDFRVRRAQIRVFDRSDEPDSDDASDMYVIEIFGVSVLIRLRIPRVGDPPELYVHIDNETRPPTDLAVEVDNRGATRYRL